MDWLTPVLFIGLTGSLILVFVHLNLYLQVRQKYLALWFAGWLLYSARSIFEILAVLGKNHKILFTLNQLSVIWSAAFLLWGACLFSRRKLNVLWPALFAGTSIWIVLNVFFGSSPLWTTVPTFLASALISIATGAAFLRFRESTGRAGLTAGWAFILWGLHKADNPWLRPVRWIAPYGYILGALLGFVSAVSIVLLHLEKTISEAKASEEKYRSIFDNAVEGVFQTTPEGRFLSANPALARICGYESAKQLIESVKDVAMQLYAHGDDRKKFRTPIDEQSFVEKFETRIKRKNGDLRWVSLNGRAVRDENGGVRFYEGFLEDVTDRKRAEEDLYTSRLHLAEAVELARIAYWEHDAASDEYIFNDAFYALYGTTAESEGGYRMARDEYIRRFVHPDDAAELLRRIQKSRGSPFRQYEHRVIRGDGEVMHMVARRRQITDPEGRIIRTVGVNQDITERKMTEEALRKSEAKFRSYVENSPLAVFVSDPEGRIVDVNRSTVDFLGFDEADLLSMHTWELHPPEDRQEILRQFETLKKTGRLEAERRFRTRDGSSLWGSLHIVMAGDGFSLAYCSDITGRKLAEEAQKRYELLSDHTRDAILFTAGDEGTIVEANAAAEEVHGYSRAELLGLTIKDLRADGTVGLARDQLRESLERGTLFEAVHRRKDGTTFPVEVSTNVRRAAIGGRRAVISIVRDITERKAAQEALASAVARLTRAERASKTGNWELDLSTGVLQASLGACRIGGFPASEAFSKVQASLLPEYRQMLDDALDALIHENAPYDVEFKIRRADNGDVVDVRSVAEYDPRRNTVFGVVQDVTERKKLEGQLLQAQKMEAVGVLAGGVAHDFNNILSVIMGLGNLIQMNLAPDDRNKPYVDQIVLSSEKAAELTQSLLAYSRKQRIALEHLRVDEVVTNAAKLLKRLLPEDIELRLELAGDAMSALVDVAQIDQVFMNLATNARDAMPGGGRFTIRTEKAILDETFRKNHGFGRPGIYARLSVSDTGVGMDEKTTARIFEPFFTTKEVGKGTGLGLASVYGIVKQHNGYIEVTSRPHEGTAFDIYLPLAGARIRKPVVTRIEIKGGSETILVIEDDPEVRKMITRILSDQGYAPLEAADGRDALKVYNQHRDGIDLVMLDVVMPGKNGKEVLDEIALLHPGVKAIFMSGYTGDVVIDKGVREESVDFLQKPIKVHQLLAKVREVLDRQTS